MGLFDDAAYVETVRDEVALNKAKDRVAEEDRQNQERLDYIKSVIDTMAGAKSAQELKKIHDVAVRKLTIRKDTRGAERISLEWKRIRLRDTSLDASKCHDTLRAKRKCVATVESCRAAALGETSR